MSNTFVHRDIVKTTTGSRTGGKVLIVACKLATAAGGKTCDPKTCTHPDKDYVWVVWQGMTKSYSYHYTELEYDTSPVASDDNAVMKDEYIEKAKAAIKDAVSSKPIAQEFDKDFWLQYNGHARMKYDRNGKPYIKEISPDATPSLKNEEIDHEKYSGRVRSKSYRKDA
jgi:hypothetical protein